LNKNIIDFIHPDDREKAIEILKSIKTGDIKTKSVEIRILAKDDNYVYFETEYKCLKGVAASDVKNKSNRKNLEEPIYIQGIAHNITERKKLEDELKRSEKKHRNILQQSNDAIYLLYNRKFEYINDKFKEMFGVTLEEVNKPEFDLMDLVAPESKKLMEEKLKNVKKDHDLSDKYEFTALSKDGKKIEVEASVNYIKYKDGIASQGILRNISERKQLEKINSVFKNISEAALTTESLDELLPLIRNSLGNIIDTTNFYLALYDEDSRKITFPYFFDVKDNPPAEVDIDHPDSLTAIVIKSGKPLLYKPKNKKRKRVLKKLLATEAEVWLGVPLILKNKVLGVIAVQSYTNSEMYSEKDINLIEAVSNHIANVIVRKKVIDTVKKSEKKYSMLFEMIPAGIQEIDLAGNIQFYNSTYLNMFGFTSEEMKDKTIFDFIYTDKERKKLAKYIKYLIQYQPEPSPWFGKNVTKNGNIIDVQVDWNYRKDDDGKITGFIVVITNITEQKKVQEAILESEHKFRELFNNANDAIFLHKLRDDGMPGKFIEVNNVACIRLEYSKDEFLKMSPADIDDPDLSGKVPAIMRKLNKKGHITFEIAHISKNGNRIPVEINSHIFKLKNEKVVLSIARDITDRKQLEKKLMLTQTAVDQFSDSVFWMDNNGMFTYVNDNASKLLGYSKKQLVNMYVWEIDTTYTKENFPEKWKNLKKEKRVVIESQHRSKEGKIIPVEIVANFLIYEGKEYVIAFARDITERKKSEKEKKELEEQLFQAQKMESIGRLAGGVAHDFNNILSGIMGYAELLKIQFDDPTTPEGKAANIILKGSEEAANLTKQLLGFAKGGKYNPEPIDINEIIKETANVLEKIFEKNIILEYDFDKDLDLIIADKNQMYQVLTNLMINAKDAMPEGGKLTFSTEDIYIDKEFAKRYPQFKSGNYIKLSVTDTGIGMTKEIKNHVFEPFFTTKKEGEGTGLGLSMVYGIIKNHNGHINCYSEPGKGTTFTIYLPVTEKKTRKKETKEEIITGSETIMVVDDEEELRYLIKAQLNKLGYNVILASNGKEAVEIYKNNKNEIDIVLLDIVMPKQSGRETYRKLKDINKDVKVILMSGFSRNGRAAEILKEGVLRFLQKPFKMKELSESIIETLKYN